MACDRSERSHVPARSGVPRGSRRDWQPDVGDATRSDGLGARAAPVTLRSLLGGTLALAQNSADPYPSLVPPSTIWALCAQSADLDAAGCAMDEPAFAHIKSNVGDRSASIGKRQEIARFELL